ncbi:MAG: ATP-binding protein [Solidesulfovibrio sp. DCME]|uniref:ATP-binding protein n=1 Tax=Solidesulfovibrio sp. DCME TaxID=3447380 RepID=UPI003D0AD8C1
MEQCELIPHINYRVIDRVIKKILESPTLAIVELIANAWDAGATKVEINWPIGEGSFFSILDNGQGMTKDEFQQRWIEIGYNRLQVQGKSVSFLYNNKEHTRLTFGRNGIGKFAAFCFGSKFKVITSKNGLKHTFLVYRNYSDTFFSAKLEDVCETSEIGTQIHSLEPFQKKVPAAFVSQQIAERFLFDPLFSVRVNQEIVSFGSIPEGQIDKREIVVRSNCVIDMYIIKRNETDRTLRFSGIAWHVNGRLVGQSSWGSLSDEKLLDGRTVNARQYAIVLKANCLADVVLHDWSGFDVEDDLYKEALGAVRNEINLFLSQLTEDSRIEKMNIVKKHANLKLRRLGALSNQQWCNFVEETISKCPSIKMSDLIKLGDMLLNLQLSQGKYAILNILSQLQPGEWDKLGSILNEWTIDMAKEVLDEIQLRLTLIDELRQRLSDRDSLEVQDIQPVLEKALWIFGPEFESIQFTSNQTIASVFAKMKGIKVKGVSKNRPDFVLLEDGAASFYSADDFGDDYHEIGLKQLLIVELKAPSVAIGREEKNQPAKYVDEFKSRGLISEETKVTAFVLGSNKQKSLSLDPMVEGFFVTRVMLFHTLLKRAESRLFNLRTKVQGAPFLQRNNVLAAC